MEVITNENIISLGFLAKDMFVKQVLVMDEDGSSYDVVQTIQEDTLEKIKALPEEGGFNQTVKDGTIRAFEKMKVGEKFLCVNDWLENYKCSRAKFYSKVQELVNQDIPLQEAAFQANEVTPKDEAETK
jgi:hypothetical protein